MVFNLRTRNLRWQQHLDLSTDHTQYRAYIYSAPTLVDLNRDGKMEIIVGTSMVQHLSCMHTCMFWSNTDIPKVGVGSFACADVQLLF